MLRRVCSPRDAALAVLRERFDGAPDAPGDVAADPAGAHHAGLVAFQVEAVQRLRDMLGRRGGAILADSVGLGKTHVARAVIRDAMRSGGGHTLVCGPAALRSHWRRHLRGVEHWEWLSHTSLSRDAGTRAAPSLIVVDEAHAFRNDATRRYRRLATLCGNADVLLLTATPVNNSIMDFYHLVRLFSTRHDFADVGVLDLLAAVETAATDAGPLRRVVEAVVVRRTRDLIERFWQPADGRAAVRPAGADRHATSSAQQATVSPKPVLRFPRREHVRLLRYDLSLAYPGVLDAFAAALASLRFPAHAEPLRSWRSAGGTAELMRLGLLKRLESSQAAFAASLRSYSRLLHQFIAAGRRGRWLDVRRDRGLFAEVDGAVQLAFDVLALEPWPPLLDRASVLADAEHDLRAVAWLLHSLGTAGIEAPATADPKLVRLVGLLDDELRDEQVLIFTEFRETGRMLWQHLLPRGGVGLIHGAEARLGLARAGRGTVIRRFAPLANGLPTPRPHERVRTLVATDVLAEGLNLQDARAVVSYDVPWNPVRLAQRIGRVDRLGSRHTSIVTYAFRPDRHLDTLLGLVRRVRRKLRDIRTVGGDTPQFGRSDDMQPDDWSTAERLRLEYAARSAGASLAEDGTGTRRLLLASARADLPERVALVALHSGTAVHFAAVRPRTNTGRTPRRRWSVELDARAADLLLLAALDVQSLTTPLDAEWLGSAARAAQRLLQRRIAAGLDGRAGLAPDPSIRQAARVVRRWLSSRPGGASWSEASEAETILAALRQCDAATACSLAELMRECLDEDVLFNRLRQLPGVGVPIELDPRWLDRDRRALLRDRRPSRPQILVTVEFIPFDDPSARQAAG